MAADFQVALAWYVSLTTGDWELAQTSGGYLYAIPLNGGTPVSFGQYVISDVTCWNNSIALLVGPNGYYSWDGASSALALISNTQIWTVTVDRGTGTCDFVVGDRVFSTSGGSWLGTVASWDASTNTLTFQLTSTDSYPTVTQSVFSELHECSATILTVTAPVAAPSNGDWIAVYAGRVWIAQGRAVSFSGPLDYSAAAWDALLGAGTFFIPDVTLKGNITRLFPANGYLYIFGGSSIDIISNVYVPTGADPPAPIFTRTNIDAVNGTPYSYSIVLFGRLILFFNKHGIHGLSGVQVERISQDIDPTIQQLDNNQPPLISASVGQCNNILTASFLVNWFDPTMPPNSGNMTRWTLTLDNDLEITAKGAVIASAGNWSGFLSSWDTQDNTAVVSLLTGTPPQIGQTIDTDAGSFSLTLASATGTFVAGSAVSGSALPFPEHWLATVVSWDAMTSTLVIEAVHGKVTLADGQTVKQSDPSAATGIISAFTPFSPPVITAAAHFSARQTLLSFYDGKWFIHDPFTDLGTNPDATVDYIAFANAAYIDGEPTAICFRYTELTDGTKKTTLNRLFADPDALLMRKVESALWDLGSSIHTKQVLKYGVECQIDTLNCELTSAVDTITPEGQDQSAPVALAQPMVWWNANNTPLVWVNADNSVLTWINTNYQMSINDEGAYGKYVGVTIKGLSAAGVISAFNLEHQRTDATWEL